MFVMRISATGLYPVAWRAAVEHYRRSTGVDGQIAGFDFHADHYLFWVIPSDAEVREAMLDHDGAPLPGSYIGTASCNTPR